MRSLKKPRSRSSGVLPIGLALACSGLLRSPTAQADPPEDPCGGSIFIGPEHAVVDDLEQTGPDLLGQEQGGRRSVWFAYGGGPDNPAPELIEREEGGRAVRFSGTFAANSQGGLGVQMRLDGGGVSCPIDVSAMDGVRFDIRGDLLIRADVITHSTLPVDEGGGCEEDCYRSHARVVQPSEEWRTIKIPFSTLEQRGWGREDPLDTGRLHKIVFAVPAPARGAVEVDNLRFYQNGEGPWPEAPPDDAPFRDPGETVEARVADLLSRMTLREKIGQMMLGSHYGVTPDQYTWLGLGGFANGGSEQPDPPDAAGWAALAARMQENMRRTRLGIPLLLGIDAVHGHAKVLDGTIFPHNIGLGAAADAELARQVGLVTARELAATGFSWTFAPTLAVVRDQRWGRTYESPGEHPERAETLAAFISGLQTAPVPVMATAKHYLADGGAVYGTGSDDSGRPIDRGDAVMSEAALRAIHLPPFVDAVERDTGSVMVSLSSWNGGKLHGNRYLVDGVLKGELGFDGFVVSDWAGHTHLHGRTADKIRTAVNAGVDMFMLTGGYEDFADVLESLVMDGSVSRARVDDAVSRILTRKFALGLFDEGARPVDTSAVGSEEHREIAREAVRRSLVLLENEDDFLPLSRRDTVCVTGSGADSVALQSGGWTMGWQFPETPPRGTTIREAVEALVGDVAEGGGCEVGIRVVSEALGSYAEWHGDHHDPQHDDSGSCEASEGCVVVILAGRPVDIEGLLADPDTRAVVMAWYPGSEGAGVVDVLYGHRRADFSGTLPVTWKRDGADEPVLYCGDGPSALCDDVGEHYRDTPSPEVLFPYGFGLRYR